MYPSPASSSERGPGNWPLNNTLWLLSCWDRILLEVMVILPQPPKGDCYTGITGVCHHTRAAEFSINIMAFSFFKEHSKVKLRGVVAHICNPSTVGGWSKRITMSCRPAWLHSECFSSHSTNKLTNRKVSKHMNLLLCSGRDQILSKQSHKLNAHFVVCPWNDRFITVLKELIRMIEFGFSAWELRWPTILFVQSCPIFSTES